MKLHNLKYGVLLAFIGLSNQIYASSGFFEDVPTSRFIEVAIDDGFGTSYERVSQWSGRYFGSLSPGSTLDLKGGIGYTYENSGDDITSMTLHYRVYLSGSTPPSFSTQLLNIVTLLTNGDEKREETTLTLDLLTNVSSAGTWVTEFYFSAEGINAGSPFTIFFSNGGFNYGATFDATGALGVNMVNFSAYLKDDKPVLNWSTASEYNCSHFNVFSSIESEDKTLLGTVFGNGTTNKVSEYEYISAVNIQEEVLFYLEQVDYDGKTEWYGPVRVELQKDSEILAFFTQENVLQINSGNGKNKEVRLLTLEGKVVHSEILTSNNQQVVLPSIRAGMYLVQIGAGESAQYLKVIK